MRKYISFTKLSAVSALGLLAGILVVPTPVYSQAASPAEEWIKLGTGVYTDFVVSSIYKASSVKISAEFEQSASDPNTYRIQYPYDNWYDHRANDIVYNREKATPMVIHVVDGKYAWFEEFNTGLYIDTADDYGPIVGYVTVVPQALSLISSSGVQGVIAAAPDALCKYSDGSMTMTANYTVPGVSGSEQYPGIRLDVDNEPMWRGNYNGQFLLQLPSAKDLDPNMKWNTLEGKARFTDGFTSLFAYQDTPQYPSFEVEIQQNEANPDLYRIVNPYAQWNIDYSAYDFQYDNSYNYYIYIYTFPEYGLACTNTFLTGLEVRIKNDGDDAPFEMFGVQNQAYYFYQSYAATFGWYLSEVAEEFGYMFGDFKDGVFTCPGYYEEMYSGQMMQFPTFTGWTGSLAEAEENEYIYTVNKEGKFKIELPGTWESSDNPGSGDGNGSGDDPGQGNDPGEGNDPGQGEDPDAGIEGVMSGQENLPVEYFNLQGRRIANPQPGSLLIERRGSSTRKIIL